MPSVINFQAGALGLSGNVVGSLSATLAMKFRCDGGAFAALSTGQTFRKVGLVGIDKDGAGTAGKLEVYAENDGSHNIRVTLHATALGGVSTPFLANNTLPGAGTFMVVYAHWDQAHFQQVVTAYDSSGAVLTDGTNSMTATGGSNLGNLSTDSGANDNGHVSINNSISASGAACGWDGIGIYSTTISGATAQNAEPSSGDTGIQAFWKLDDGSGSSAAATVGGSALALSGTFSWATGGAWDPFSGFIMNTGVASPCFVGTVSTTGTGSGSTVGGRVAFAAGGTGDTGSSSGSLQPLTKLAAKIKFKVDALLALSGFNSQGLFSIDDGTTTSGHVKCRLLMAAADNPGTIFTFSFGAPGQGGITTGQIAASALRALGGDLIVYCFLDSGAQGITVFDGSGNQIATIAGTQNLGPLPAVTGGGRLRLNYAPDATKTGALDVDGAALYNQQISGATAQSAPPTVNDTGIVAYYRCDEQTGTTTHDDLGGPALALTSFAWEAGGIWLAPNVVNLPVTGVASPARVASLASNPTDTTGYLAVSTAPVEPSPSVTSPAVVPLTGQVNSTVYVPGVASAGAVTAPSFFSGAGPVIQMGVASRAVVGAVTPFISNPPPLVPPATLQYIVDQATAFSTANQSLAVLANTAQLIARIRADQRAVFTKIAERNRTYFLRLAAVTSASAASGRTIDLSILGVPVERVLQLVLGDQRIVNIVDILDPAGELAPRAYLMGTQLTEVGTDWSPAPGPITGTLYYVQAPTDLNPTGDLTQTVSVPTDWSDLLILPLAQWLAMQDSVQALQTGAPRADEITALQTMYDDTLETFLTYLDHYSGVPARRFDVARPLHGLR